MRTSTNLRRLGGGVAVMAAAVMGVGMFTTPAAAATGPTTTVQQGVVTVAGTPSRDVIHVTIDTNRLTVDVGFDGTVDARVSRSQFREVQVLGRGGDDGITVSGTGAV